MKKNLISPALVVLVLNNFVYAQWPQWRGPMRNGCSTETDLLKSWPAEGPKLLWSCDTIGQGYSSAIIQDKKIYITGMTDSARLITAMDLSGKVIWEEEIGDANSEDESGECSTPTLYRDKLYTFTSPGEMYCIDAETGGIDWKVNIPDKFGVESHVCESPLVIDDKVIVSPYGEETTIIAMNRTSGETIWQSEHIADETAYVSPVLVQGEDKKIVVTNGRKYVIAVDLETGEIIWQGELSAETFVPMPDENQVYIPSSMMLNIDPDQGSVDTRWQETRRINVFGGAVKLGNRIFGTYQQSPGIFCLDWETGKRLAVNNGIRGANLLAADGMIYSYEDPGGRVCLLKPTENSIEIVGSFHVEQGEGENLAHMSIAEGILFVRHGSVLMAYDIKQQKGDQSP